MPGLRCSGGLVAAVLVSATALSAQVWSAERHRSFPQVMPWAPAVTIADAAAGDIDADGDVDVVVLTWFSFSSPVLTPPVVIIARNDGHGRFVPDAVTIPVGGLLAPPQSIALGDIDADGDLDLAVGGIIAFSSPQPGRLFRNDGAAGFADVSSQWSSVSEGARQMRFVDVDGDGDQDLLTCNLMAGQSLPLGWPQAINRLYLNNGAGVLTDVTPAAMPNLPRLNYALDVGDLDGDGDIDLVVVTVATSSTPGEVRTFLQGPSGHFTETPGFVPASILLGGGYTDVALSDHDGDGDLDVAVASNTGVEFFTNAGAGVFAAAGVFADPWARALVPGDFDGNGRGDYLVVRHGYTGPSLAARLLLNIGGTFVDATATHLEAATLAPRPARAFDCDGDQDIDLWGGAVPQPLLWHNDGQGHLLQVTTRELSNTNVLVAALGDVDGDGDLDAAVISGRSGDPSEVLFSDNIGGALSSTTQVLVARDELLIPRALQWIDVDLDGDLDLFVGVENGFDRLFHRVGAAFVDVSATQLPGVGGTRHVAAGDITGDGVIDLVAAGIATSPCRLLQGNGSGGFVDASAVLPGVLGSATGVALLDFDQDGDLDLAEAVSTSSAGGFRILRNDWPAPFVDVTAGFGLPSVNAVAVAAVDVDRDGRLDLAVGNHAPAPGANGLMLFRSVGSGFVDETAARITVPLPAVTAIAVTDLDGDGWSDLGCRFSVLLPVDLRNDSGVFAPFAGAWAAFGGTLLPERPAAGDLDGDGDQDLVHSYGMLRNITRQLQNAVPPRLGMQAELVVHAYGGNGVDPQAALLLLSPQLAAPPIVVPGLGTLFLDPATAAYHSTHLIPGTGGEAVIGYTVPSSPSVLGSAIFAQAVFVHEPDPATWRLGNYLELRVRL